MLNTAPSSNPCSFAAAIVVVKVVWKSEVTVVDYIFVGVLDAAVPQQLSYCITNEKMPFSQH